MGFPIMLASLVRQRGDCSNSYDPALIVEKRFGIGWTLNFAHRGQWVFMALMLAALVLSLNMPLLSRLR
jgi:uncharacterized protein DUF5808